MNEEQTFSALDRQFGEFIERLHGSVAPALRAAAMLTSRRRAEGHICVPLADLADALPPSRTVGAADEFTPLVLASGRLYLRRYWEYEQQLARAILQRAASPKKLPRKPGADLQQLAARNALARNFSVITGGPGTGKTHTVRAILERLRAAAGGADLKIALAAPTGKAAARLTDALREISAGTEATTIHRLLGAIPGSPSVHHHAEHPLLADVVIVDEASMVDLALMAKLLDAVRPEARLVLLGDRDQLASVEAGNVLADICAAAEAAAPNEPLHGAVIALQRNFRFADTGGIYRLSHAINTGAVEEAVTTLREEGEVHWEPLPAPAQLATGLRARVISGFRPYLEASDPRAALACLPQFRILAAVRHGPFGVENLNAIAEEILREAGLLTPRRGWYAGQPLMITQNDYNLALFNGDSGIILPDPEARDELRAFFLSAAGTLRRFLPSRLPGHETAFAITVHKSQGSEFDRLLLVLPEKDSPVLTRELLYTALTRARRGAELWGHEAIFRAAMERRTVRTSGLVEALRGGARS